jgi:hypothetical protein
MDAAHFTSKADAGQAAFHPVEQYGMRTDAPVDVQSGARRDIGMYFSCQFGCGILTQT